MAQSTDNAADLYLGAGKVYIDRLDANRARTGERYLGNCTAFEVSTTDEVKDKYSSSDRSRGLLKSVNVRRTPELRIVLDEFNPDNLALSTMGAKTAFAQTGATKNNYVPPAARVKQGHYFPVEDPSGTPRRQISAVVVTGPSATPVYTVTTDYTVDAVTGRIYIVPGGAIADAAALEVDFTYATIAGTTLPYVQAGTSNFIEAFIRFIGDPSAGPVMEAEVWLVSLTPDGSLGFISEEYGEITMKGKVLADTTNHSTEPFYRVFEISA